MCYFSSTCEGLHELLIRESRKKRRKLRKGVNMFFSNDGRWKNVVQAGGTAGTMGLHIVSSIIVGLVVGYYLDEWLGTKPWMIMIWFLLGVVAGFRLVFQEFRKLQRRQEGQQHSSLKQEGNKSAGDDKSDS